MKKLTLTLALVVSLTACGGAAADGEGSTYREKLDSASKPKTGLTDMGDDGELRQESIKLKDGRKVVCVVYSSYKQGGVSCDWESAQTPR